MELQQMSYEQLKETKEQIDNLMQQRREEVLQELRTKAAVMGFSMETVLLRTNGAAKPKYRGPNGETWTGKGKRPAWINAIVDSGGDIEDYRA
jgi:DNA-binding protein H-NS